MSTSLAVIIVLAGAVVALAAILLIQQRKTQRLKTKFGPEYGRVLDREGSPRRAEAVLDARQKRLEKYEIRHLSRDERGRFAAEWQVVQERFVDDPRGSVAQADEIMNAALRTRGYPMGDFEQQAADISVEHPSVVEHYRAAHAISLRDQRGQASTEDLRQAMRHYRDLFENVLETNLVHHEDIHQ
jgi:hypothetical protein